MLVLFLESAIVFLSFNMQNEIMIIMWNIYLTQDAMILFHFYFAVILEGRILIWDNNHDLLQHRTLKPKITDDNF